MKWSPTYSHLMWPLWNSKLFDEGSYSSQANIRGFTGSLNPGCPFLQVFFNALQTLRNLTAFLFLTYVAWIV